MAGGSSDQRTLRQQGCMCPVGHQLPNTGMFRSWGRNRSEPSVQTVHTDRRQQRWLPAFQSAAGMPCNDIWRPITVRQMLSHVESRSDIEQAVPSQHSFAVATMINPCDLLLFDQASSSATGSGTESPKKRRFVSGRELYEDQESRIDGRLLR